MWKKATKIVLNSYIILGIIGTILSAIASGLVCFMIGETYAILLQTPELETTATILAIITGIITLISSAFITFMGATSIGLKLEMAEDIEQIKENTKPQTTKQMQTEEEININKYIYPYQ